MDHDRRLSRPMSPSRFRHLFANLRWHLIEKLSRNPFDPSPNSREPFPGEHLIVFTSPSFIAWIALSLGRRIIRLSGGFLFGHLYVF